MRAMWIETHLYRTNTMHKFMIMLDQLLLANILMGEMHAQRRTFWTKVILRI